MPKNESLNKIRSNYILSQIFSYFQLNYSYKLIKYSKSLQNKLDMNLEESMFNHKYTIKTKSEIKSNIEEMKGKLKSKPSSFVPMSDLSFSSEFCLKYSYPFEENINENDEKFIFLTNYKGFKINDYPLPVNFDSMSILEKIKIFEKNESFLKYSLNDKNIELITLINELRKKNNIKELIYFQIQILNDFFKYKDLANVKHIFKYPIGEFKKKLLINDKNVINILLNNYLKYIMILEKEKKEYIFIYSKSKLNNFHIINNTIPEININDSVIMMKSIKSNLNIIICNNSSGYQIFSYKHDTLLGVLEGPPNTPYENGYFLFKILFPKQFPITAPQFCFLSTIFHPNISENGYVSVNFLDIDWTPALMIFETIIYSIQSLLDDPNPDNYLNETAAHLYKKDRKTYDETVKEYTNLYSNYSKFLEDIKNMNIEINKEGEKFRI